MGFHSVKKQPSYSIMITGTDKDLFQEVLSYLKVHLLCTQKQNIIAMLLLLA